jgi:hypothetical protein
LELSGASWNFRYIEGISKPENLKNLDISGAPEIRPKIPRSLR